MTVISHIYNESYLLPWWLSHHKWIFDHGIIIDYGSTDNSVEIVKQICPQWEIRRSKNELFKASAVDEEVMEIESEVFGMKCVLNITEFLVPGEDFKTLKFTDKAGLYKIPRATVVDNEPENFPVYHKPLVKQKYFGFKGNNFINGACRFVHNHNDGQYHTGRHGTNHQVDKELDQSLIMWYGFAPWTEQFKNRKLQIKDKMPEEDKKANFGFQHLWELQELEEKRIQLLEQSYDLRKYFAAG